MTNKDALDAGKPSKGPAAEVQGEIGLLFLSNFVHQIVNPLNGVVGTLSNITDGTYPEAVLKQKINATRAQLEQCISLIRNLAYISDYFSDKSEKKVLRPPIREVSTSVLPQVIIEAVQFFQIAAEKRNIHIELTDARTQYRVSVRTELLKQVFINLFDNWLKYGLKDQTIKVDVSVTAKKDLVISIHGSSVGFDGNDAERIFDLGFRARQAKSIVAQGSGIGLHICKLIMANELSGTIKAEHNQKTSVTTFRLSIPSEKWQL